MTETYQDRLNEAKAREFERLVRTAPWWSRWPMQLGMLTAIVVIGARRGLLQHKDGRRFMLNMMRGVGKAPRRRTSSKNANIS